MKTIRRNLEKAKPRRSGATSGWGQFAKGIYASQTWWSRRVPGWRGGGRVPNEGIQFPRLKNPKDLNKWERAGFFFFFFNLQCCNFALKDFVLSNLRNSVSDDAGLHWLLCHQAKFSPGECLQLHRGRVISKVCSEHRLAGGPYVSSSGEMPAVWAGAVGDGDAESWGSSHRPQGPGRSDSRPTTSFSCCISSTSESSYVL